jgi:hypothetical protein
VITQALLLESSVYRNLFNITNQGTAVEEIFISALYFSEMLHMLTFIHLKYFHSDFCHTSIAISAYYIVKPYCPSACISGCDLILASENLMWRNFTKFCRKFRVSSRQSTIKRSLYKAHVVLPINSFADVTEARNGVLPPGDAEQVRLQAYWYIKCLAYLIS